MGLTEEESILSGARVMDYGKFNAVFTPDPNEFIGDGFKSLIESSNCCDMVDFTIDFGIQ